MTPRHAVLLGLLLLLAACGTTPRPSSPPGKSAGSEVPSYQPQGYYKLGKPYRVKGRWYYPAYDPDYDRVGVASWYGDDFHGLPTANGEVFDKDEITAAHPTLPLPSRVRVTNLENGRQIVLRVNDRGPFIGSRVIDLSQGAARRLGYEGQGLARVRVEFLGLAEARGTPPTPVRLAGTPRPAAAPRVAAARPTPPRPAIASRPAPLGLPPDRPVQVAALAAATVSPCAVEGPAFVQVGAFANTVRVREVMDDVGRLDRVQIEPTFVAGKAAARVRLGPVTGTDEASRLLAQVRALGYTDAFLTTAASSGRGAVLAC